MLASWEEARQSTLRHDGERVRAESARNAAAALADAVRAEATQLDALAAAALDAPVGPRQAFLALSALAPAGGARAVVLARNGEAEAWSGRVLLNLDSLPARRGLIATPFYLIAYAVQQRGALTALATSVISAEPPADALVDAIAARIADDAKASGLVFAAPEAAAAAQRPR
jgi:hypothetical protein